MQDQLTALRAQALTAIAAANTEAALNEARVQFTGKKSQLNGLLRGMGALSEQERRDFGAAVNEARDEIAEAIATAEKALGEKAMLQQIEQETLDVTWPCEPPSAGGLSPMTRVQRLVESIFLRMGFDVIEGREIEDDRHNFELLNVPAGHPARDMQDTFWLQDGSLLRTQTSSVQARFMTQNQPPIRIVCP
ncbi:MAG: phenylalanine--tRNA ligase subunit alpha, partial [Clostridia bacterium]|nr:phenylalanine--tRNA ligase subunit alpha [Clostridia bacterium]